MGTDIFLALQKQGAKALKSDDTMCKNDGQIRSSLTKKATKNLAAFLR